MAGKTKQQTLGRKALAAGDISEAQADAIDAHERAQNAAQEEPDEPGTVADAPKPVEHRQQAPVSPAPQTGEDAVALRHLRRAVEDAAFSRHPQAAEAALEAVRLVPMMRASRGVQAYRAEVEDFLKGKIAKRAAGAA